MPSIGFLSVEMTQNDVLGAHVFQVAVCAAHFLSFSFSGLDPVVCPAAVTIFEKRAKE